MRLHTRSRSAAFVLERLPDSLAEEHFHAEATRSTRFVCTADKCPPGVDHRVLNGKAGKVAFLIIAGMFVVGIGVREGAARLFLVRLLFLVLHGAHCVRNGPDGVGMVHLLRSDVRASF